MAQIKKWGVWDMLRVNYGRLIHIKYVHNTVRTTPSTANFHFGVNTCWTFLTEATPFGPTWDQA